ncbi:MAG: YncE family protein [Bacteroidota bacterium]
MQKSGSILFTALTLVVAILFSACTSEKATPDYNKYPDDIGKLVFTKCAVSGCHNDESKDAAGGLSMEGWNKLFEGGTAGACLVPYRSDYSTLFYYTNTFPDMGVTLKPTMPYNKEHLTREEVTLIKNWIDAGAPNRDGFVKFSDDPNRKKFYVTNQACDVVTVFDQETLLPMRYVDVGATANSESPHMVKVSPDGQYWYVLFLTGNILEKYRTSDDSFVGRANLTIGQWNTFVISSNSNTAYCVDYANARIATVNLNTLAASSLVIPGGNFPHGSELNNTDDTLYVTQQQGNKLHKILVDFSFITEVNLYTSIPPTTLNVHEIRFSPDGKKYAVTCEGTNEIRLFQTGTDQLLSIIPVGAKPQELSFSTTTNYLFVTCMEDVSNFPGKRGSVAVIDYSTNTFVKHIYTGHQPHGIEVDDAKKTVYVVNRNASADSPAPHHESLCLGRNGNVSFIDLNTLTMVSTSTGNIKRQEISVDPYSVAIRH